MFYDKLQKELSKIYEQMLLNEQLQEPETEFHGPSENGEQVHHIVGDMLINNKDIPSYLIDSISNSPNAALGLFTRLVDENYIKLTDDYDGGSNNIPECIFKGLLSGNDPSRNASNLNAFISTLGRTFRVPRRTSQVYDLLRCGFTKSFIDNAISISKKGYAHSELGKVELLSDEDCKLFYGDYKK